MALQNAFGNLMLDTTGASLKVVDPDGTLNASVDPSSLLLDAFDVAITTYWTTGGTAPTVANSAATFASNTTASTASYMRTTNPFILRAQSYLRSSMHAQVNTAAIANNTRWLGIGTNQASPTAANPVLNGAVFIWDYAAGAMQAATYNAGTKTVIATLTQPTDGGFHKYEIWYRQSRVDWVIDGVVAATRIQPSFGAVQSPYMIAGSINHTTAPSTAPTLVLGGASIADQAGNNKALSDGVDQSIQATVKRAQAPTVTSVDNLQAVLSVPAVGQVVTGYSASSATAVTATVPAPGAGLRNYITSITFERFALAAMTASGTPIVSTAGNHGFVMTLPQDAAAIGTKTEYTRTFPGAGIASTAQNTATTFTAPAVTNASWRVTVTYYIAP